ncbi:hypothetical protein HLB42_21895 (plasmid) [Deinococcus sp. D7000]|nr:hypothetical protein HLB42_21895 [Deinococcus sp. D7000]
MLKEVYKGREIVIDFSPLPNRPLGRHAAARKNWTVKIDGENILDRISYIGIRDENLIMSAAKKYVDKLS